MPYVVKFMRSRATVFKSEPLESFLGACAFAKQHQHKVPGAVLMLIMETDRDGRETHVREIVKL